ncbi:MAG TPA: DUF1799 domain-containing protein [Propionibacteriaceae bacterium]|nr:DUF1799 domain-containing protein [Propionibacteriaceae bacterium]
MRQVNPDGWFYDDAAKDWRCELWEENWPPMRLYRRLATQWRVGMNGPIGLDYNVVFHELDRLGLDRDDYDDLFGSLQIIEETVLTKPA